MSIAQITNPFSVHALKRKLQFSLKLSTHGGIHFVVTWPISWHQLSTTVLQLAGYNNTVHTVILFLLGNTWIMVLCGASGCDHRTYRNLSDKRSFYSKSNRNIHPEKRDIAAQWLHSIRTWWTAKNFKVASYKRVCEDHFEAPCFLDDVQARLVGYQRKKCWKVM